MSHLVALFENQKDAEKAVSELSKADIGENDIRTIEDWYDDEENPKMNAIPAVNPGYGTGAVGVAAPFANLPQSLGLTEQENQYFKNAVQNGGTLVVVSVEDDDNIPETRRILDKYSDQIANS